MSEAQSLASIATSLQGIQGALGFISVVLIWIAITK